MQDTIRVSTEPAQGVFRQPWVPYVLPFLALLLLLALEGRWPVPPTVEYPARAIVLAAMLAVVSRRVIDLRAPHWVASVGVGVVVFAVWIAPDVLWPAWRDHWLFRNPLTEPAGAAPDYARMPGLAVAFRIVRAVILVPVIEELFWRGWMMRWLVSPRFDTLPLGTYSRSAFWITAALFAVEHGVYWDVGLIAGLVYNAWMIRTRRLGDCILAHAVTNACLAAHVLATGHWNYW